MENRNRRLVPFAVAAAILFVLCIAVARLPDSYVAELERDRPFTSSQAGWAYRLLALAAVGQALYGGFFIFQVERVRRSRAEDEGLAALSPSEVVRRLARTAAGMTLLTLVYGLASFFVTGQRGGFWLFPVIAVAQGAWYFRQVGQVATWLELQPRRDERARRRRPSWRREPPDYSPPLGR